MTTGKREWNTPLRSPWNPVIKSCLNAVDQHIRLYLETGDRFHLGQAQTLREYVAYLKDWIHSEEKETPETHRKHTGNTPET